MNWEIKLTDFGFASHFDENNKFKHILGSPIYMPPEILQRKEYDSKVDIWSTGVAAYILLAVGEIPFKGTTKKEIYKAIKYNDVEFNSSAWSNIAD